jgi:L-ribulose-5-phosphate 3-epimerase
MQLGYNTNGLPHHRTDDALRLIAETGYRSVALTVDHHCCNPFAPGFESEAERIRGLLEELRLDCVVETGARFLLNPRNKHEPTLVSPKPEDRAVRVDFLKRCIDLAVILRADAVSFWSGVLRDDAPRDVAMQRLIEGLQPVIDFATDRNVRLAFEPEPGMFIERFADFEELLNRIGLSTTHHSPPLTRHSPLGLTVDIGHVHCVETGDIAGYVRDWRGKIFNVHIEDMVRGVHEHLRFGDGEIEFPSVLAALKEIGYEGGIHVELSRHGHLAPTVLTESYQFLQSILSLNP